MEPPQFLGKDLLDIKTEVIQVSFSLTASPILPLLSTTPGE